MDLPGVVHAYSNDEPEPMVGVARTRLHSEEEEMPRQCVFYLRGYRDHCEVAKALGRGPLGRERAELLQHTYCSNTGFRQCPLFRQLERYLASSDRRPVILQPAA